MKHILSALARHYEENGYEPTAITFTDEEKESLSKAFDEWRNNSGGLPPQEITVAQGKESRIIFRHEIVEWLAYLSADELQLVLSEVTNYQQSDKYKLITGNRS